MTEGTSIRFITTVVPTQQPKISFQIIGDITIHKNCSVLCLTVGGKSIKVTNVLEIRICGPLELGLLMLYL
jgi:hypothetical protein